MTDINWRWRERLVPKDFIGLFQGSGREAATAAAVAAGRYSASRVYEVSVDGGQTWHSAPPDMPVVDINGDPMPEDRRRTANRPSEAAAREIARRMLEAEQR